MRRTFKSVTCLAVVLSVAALGIVVSVVILIILLVVLLSVVLLIAVLILVTVIVSVIHFFNLLLFSPYIFDLRRQICYTLKMLENQEKIVYNDINYLQRNDVYAQQRYFASYFQPAR